MPPEIDLENLRDRYKKSYVKGLKRLFKGERATLDEIIKIGAENSQGPVWIVGGEVYRLPTEEEYGIKTKRSKDNEGREIIDVDLVVSQLSVEPYRPRILGWSEWRTRFGNPAFRKNEYNVVLMDLSSFSTLAAGGLRPTIEDFLAATPLDIQSIAVPVGDNPYEPTTLLGDKGILAIYNREVKVNDLKSSINRILREWTYEAQEFGIDLEQFEKYIKEINLNPIVIEFVKKKASELGFKPNLTLPPLKEDPANNHGNDPTDNHGIIPTEYNPGAGRIINPETGKPF